MSTPTNGTLEAYRRQIERVANSAEFSGSRQLREFLSYVGEAALEGRHHVGQEEIANAVLGRGDSFNPLDDASVRKIATLTRKRLQRYYENEGVNDAVVITLPVRRYLPQFRLRGDAAALAEPPAVEWPEDAREPGRRRFLPWTAVAAALALVALAIWVWRRPEGSPRNSFVIQTSRGDFMHQTLDLPPNGIQLGPLVPENGDITVRLHFIPESAYQQAGLLIYESPDQYVKLGRQFLSRAELEFGQEIRGKYEKPPGTFTFDPEGQTGQPVWLSIRRRGSSFRAFSSQDGIHWRPVGNELVMRDPMPNARAAIYAHHGRTEAPPATAIFDSLSIGEEFHDRQPGPVNPGGLAGWQITTNCPEGAGVGFDPSALVFSFGASPQGCRTDMLRPAPKGDWTVSAKVDFLPENGSAAGLTAVGSLGQFRIIRWDLNGGSVSAEFFTKNQVNQPDFPGSPPLVLRLDCRDGVITSRWSRDNLHFQTLDYHVPARTLGEDLRVGLHLSRSTWVSQPVLPPVRFSYFREHATKLVNFR